MCYCSRGCTEPTVSYLGVFFFLFGPDFSFVGVHPVLSVLVCQAVGVCSGKVGVRNRIALNE